MQEVDFSTSGGIAYEWESTFIWNAAKMAATSRSYDPG
jgi:hypothetical protein